MSINLHPAIQRAIHLAEEDYPEEAKSASEYLPRLLSGLLHSKQVEEAWSFSKLSQEGFPLEFAFISGDRSLRYTLEVTAPEIAPAQGLNDAHQLLVELGAASIPEDLLSTFYLLQAEGKLKYGAWLGVRHQNQKNSFKVYVEIPPEANAKGSAWVNQLLGNSSVLLKRSPCLNMVAYSDQGLEFYYHIHHLRPGEIETLLQRIGIEGRGQEVLNLLQDAYMRSLLKELPATKMGYSYFIPWKQHRPKIGTIYNFCSSLFGGDGRTRRSLLKFIESRGAQMPFYRKLSAPLEQRRGFLCRHGMFGIIVMPDAPLEFTFGMTPPEVML